MRPNKLGVVEWSRRTLRSNSIILDTETTGLDRNAEIIQLAIIDLQGEILLDTLIRPSFPLALAERRGQRGKDVPPGAGSIRIHGLTLVPPPSAYRKEAAGNADRLATAPALHDYAEQLQTLLSTRPVLIYSFPLRPCGTQRRKGNMADFDLRMLRQSLFAHQLAFTWLNFVHHTCVMEQYAVYHGERRRGGGYKWQSLPGGDHTALGDARATLALLQRMAATNEQEAKTWFARL